MRWQKREGRLIDLIKAIGPILIGVGGITTAILVYINTRGANRNVSDKNKTDKYEVLDAKQEQIAEWGFKAADDANKRADRIAAEMQVKIADLQEKLDALAHDLAQQVELLRTIRIEHAKEMKTVVDQHQREIDERNRRIYALEDTIKRQQGDRGRQTDEAVRQTDEALRQSEVNKRQGDTDTRQEKENTRQQGEDVRQRGENMRQRDEETRLNKRRNDEQ